MMGVLGRKGEVRNNRRLEVKKKGNVFELLVMTRMYWLRM
jgi:hypothetical protein